MQKTKNIRITEEDFAFLSGFTNLGASQNMTLIIDMMRRSTSALSVFMEYMSIQDEANRCSAEKKTLFVDYKLYSVEKIKKLESRLRSANYRNRPKVKGKDDYVIPDSHMEAMKEIEEKGFNFDPDREL